jgi:hypothetical protein
VLAAFGAKVPGTTTTTKKGTPTAGTVPSGTEVLLYNGSGREGLVGQVQGELQRLGIQASSGGNGSTASTTQVRHRSGNEAAARAVKAYLGGDAELSVDRSVKSGEVVVLLGRSFTGVIDPRSSSTSTTVVSTTALTTPTTKPPVGSDPSRAC